MAAEACAKALAINPAEPTALRVRARLAMDTCWDFEAVERNLARAIAYAPADSDVLVAYAEVMALRRGLDRAIEFSDQAYRLNPADYFTLATRYWVGLASGRYKQAMQAIDEIEAFILHPFLNQWARGLVYDVTDQPEITIVTTEDTLDQLLGTSRAPLASALAIAYALVGRFDDALDTLDEAVLAHEAGINFMALVPVFKPLYQHPRYKRILEKVGIPQWWSPHSTDGIASDSL